MLGITTARTTVVFRASGSARRPDVKCHERHGNRQSNPLHPDDDNGYMIFKSSTAKHSITLYDVQDAYECCSTILNDQMKEACYLQFGVDGKMAEKYLNTVKLMEDMYSDPDLDYEPNEKKKKSEPLRLAEDIFFKREDKNPKQPKQPKRKWFKFGIDFDTYE